MMITLGRMVCGPRGELDCIAIGETIEQDHLARLKKAERLVLGSGVVPETSSSWIVAENTENDGDMIRELGRAMNAARTGGLAILGCHDARGARRDSAARIRASTVA
jgi:hypothetical protein